MISRHAIQVAALAVCVGAASLPSARTAEPGPPVILLLLPHVPLLHLDLLGPL
jgi:hypothetical protein